MIVANTQTMLSLCQPVDVQFSCSLTIAEIAATDICQAATQFINVANAN